MPISVLITYLVSPRPSKLEGVFCDLGNVGALIIRIGFWAMLHYNSTKEGPPIIETPVKLNLVRASEKPANKP